MKPWLTLSSTQQYELVTAVLGLGALEKGPVPPRGGCDAPLPGAEGDAKVGVERPHRGAVGHAFKVQPHRPGRLQEPVDGGGVGGFFESDGDGGGFVVLDEEADPTTAARLQVGGAA